MQQQQLRLKCQDLLTKQRRGPCTYKEGLKFLELTQLLVAIPTILSVDACKVHRPHGAYADRGSSGLLRRPGGSRGRGAAGGRIEPPRSGTGYTSPPLNEESICPRIAVGFRSPKGTTVRTTAECLEGHLLHRVLAASLYSLSGAPLPLAHIWRVAALRAALRLSNA